MHMHNAMVSKLIKCVWEGGGGVPWENPFCTDIQDKVHMDIVIRVLQFNCSFVQGYSSISWSVGTRLMYVQLVEGAERSSY